MGRTLVMSKIDVSKLNQALQKKKLSDDEAGHQMGHAEGFIRHVRTRGTMSMTDVILFKSLFGADVTYKEPEVEPQKVGANNDALVKQLAFIKEELTTMKQNNEDNTNLMFSNIDDKLQDISISLHNIGNLLTQINEKCMRK